MLVNEDFLAQPFYQKMEVTLLSTILKIGGKKDLHCTAPTNLVLVTEKCDKVKVTFIC